MTRRQALVGLNLILDIGSIRLKKLLDFFDTPQNIIKANSRRLAAVSGIGEKLAQKISGIREEDIDNEFSLADKKGLRIITVEDSDYPSNLREIADPPPVLYLKGRLSADDNLGIAMVGSRRASAYGLRHAYKFAQELSAFGFTIISGLARGIDASAHRGALATAGRTIAVIGSGFDRLYPLEHNKLAEEIAESGAVISEFPINTEPLAQNFPRRNRVISGLSLGVIVVEAARNSGALITANFALEQGRDVFALPAQIDSENSFGVNELIKEGAQLVSSTAEILEEYRSRVCVKAERNPCPQDESALLSENKEEQAICRIISDSLVHIDELREKTMLDITRISDILLKLQLKGLIRQLPGKYFMKGSHG